MQEISCSTIIRQSARQSSLLRGIGWELAVFCNGDGSLDDGSIAHAFSSEFVAAANKIHFSSDR
jgi:hypothetical protein